MPKRRPRRSKGRRAAGWQIAGGLVLVGTVILVLAFGFYLLIVTRESHVALDPETYCPKAGPHAVTAVIVDTTDALNLVQRTDLMNEIEKLIAAVPRFAALEIYAVGPVEEEPPQPVFRKCNPGRAAEISEWTGNPTMVERDWREGFREPLEKVLARMLTASEAASSPILESIQWVTINALTSPGRSELPRRLVVVSDLLQYTAGLSHYQGVGEFATFAQTPYYRRIRAPLDGVTVDLLMVRRDTQRRSRKIAPSGRSTGLATATSRLLTARLLVIPARGSVTSR
jgi:hypothetical protein